VSVAERHGLKLGLYGAGWDRNPRFAAHARGPVRYGAPLEELTRRTKINLALEPFFTPSHQRLLDGLVAGGFFLTRDHPTNRIFPELWQFVLRHVPAGAATLGAARDALGEDLRHAFDGLVARFACLAEYGDPVGLVRDGRAAEVLPDAGEALPDLATVSFRDPASFEARVIEFLGSPQRRREIAARQREHVEGRRSYTAGMRRIVRSIGQLLAADDEAGRGTRRAA
jgi:hypothetical protein